MTDDEKIEAYLDDLLVQLRGSPRTIRLVLAEAEAHLRDAVADGRDVDEAIRRFGHPRVVAAASNRQGAVPLPVLARQLVLAAGLLAAIGCLAIGASGLLSAGMDAVYGPRFVAGDLPSITYTTDRCADYRDLVPGASTCAAAAARHHTDEVESFRIATGFLGLIGLAGHAALRRRWRATPAMGALPPAMVPGIGAAVFGVATVTLASQAMQSIGWHSTAGLGQWLSAALVSAAVTGFFAVWLFRVLRHPHDVVVVAG